MGHGFRFSLWFVLVAVMLFTCRNAAADAASGAGQVALTANVDDASIDYEKGRHSEFRLAFGTPSPSGKNWSNSVNIYCSKRINSVFVSSSGHFGFSLNYVDKGLMASVKLLTAETHVAQTESPSLVTHPSGFSTWMGIERESLRQVLDSLGHGKSIRFVVDEDDTSLKAISLTLKNYEGVNAFSVFREDCERFWANPAA